MAAVAEWLSSAPAAAIRGAAAAVAVAVDVFHVGRVVVVGHDHGPAAVSAGNDDDQVALVGLAVLVALPAARPGEVEVGLPAEGQLADEDLVRSCRPRRRPSRSSPADNRPGPPGRGGDACSFAAGLVGSSTQSALSLFVKRPVASLAIVCQ